MQYVCVKSVVADNYGSSQTVLWGVFGGLIQSSYGSGEAAISQSGGSAVDGLVMSVRWKEFSCVGRPVFFKFLRKKALLYFLDQCSAVSGPCEVLGNVNAQTPKAGHSLHSVSVSISVSDFN